VQKEVEDSHSHGHAEHDAEACEDTACTDPTHDHSHGHNEHAAEACEDTACTDPTHDHSHNNEHSDEACADPDCTDTSHSHSHSSNAHSTSTDELGISSFVYNAPAPFNSGRLMKLLSKVRMVLSL
jgi:hypothetical protein